MKTAEEFLKEKNIATFGAIICDGKQLVELLTEFAQEQASFISSKQDVIKSVCECVVPKKANDPNDGEPFCTKCGKPI